MADSPYIFEANSENFSQILEESHEVPVLVDFWADWCQPCQMLMPVLAKLANEMQGAFLLVKVNSDENQDLATQYGVRSLPTVKLFKQGQVVDEFMGVQQESVIRDMINKHRTRRSEAVRQQALMLQQQGELEQATELMQKVVDAEPDYHEAVLDLVELLVLQGQTENLADILDRMAEDQVDAVRLNQLKSQLKLIEMKAQVGDVKALETRFAEDPDDLENMQELAKTNVALERIEEALDLYLTLMKKDRQFGDDAGRKGLLEVFDILGSGHPLVKEYRSKMFSLLY